MAQSRPRASRAGKTRRWLMPPALALMGSAVICAPAVAQAPSPAADGGSPTIVISGDSLLATSLSSFGQATVTVTRPDAITGAPVAIGAYSGSANPFIPFSVNTTTPTPLDPSGDCWQKGALTQALTPDLQPGDTVSLTQTGLFGSGGSSSSTVVQQSDLSGATLGPISGCSSIAPWARNAITSAPADVQSGEALTVSGVAQPLATGVSVSASDGTDTTTPVTATPAADGTWSATIPASALDALGGSSLTVTPVFAVPDVSTGASGHIAGVGADVSETTPSTPPAPASSEPSQTPGAAPATAPTTTPVQATPKPQRRVTGLRAAARLSLATARRTGIRASFIVPTGVHVVEIQLLRGRTSAYTAYVIAHKAGARQTITLPARLADRLKPGSYQLSVKTGVTPATLGPPAGRTIRLTSLTTNA